jgi:hypothetical protein
VPAQAKKHFILLTANKSFHWSGESMRRLSLLLPLLTVMCFGQPQERPAITGIAFVRVYASNAAASADFYGKTLGFHGTKSGDLAIYSVNDAQWLEVKPLPTPPTA